MPSIRPSVLLVPVLALAMGIAAFPGLARNGTARQEANLTTPTLPFGWVVQASGSEASLRGVSAVDGKTAWASGSRGTVLRTVDGGESWRMLAVPGAEAVDFRDIEAFDPDTAVVMGIDRPAKIYRTEDGGATWKETYHNDEPGIFLDGLAFFDDRSGLAVGDPMGGRLFVLTTEDGGRSWQPLPLADRPAAVEGEGIFAASGTSLAGQGRSMAWIATGGPVTRVWRSTDKGRHWEEAASPLLSGQPSLGTFSVAFLDERNGLLVGGDYRNETADAGNAAFSVDGGRTWSAGPGRRPGGFRECVAFVPGTSPRMAVTVGPSGSDYSLDRGRTWAPMPGPAGFHSASFARTGKTGWAVGKGGLIARFAFSE